MSTPPPPVPLPPVPRRLEAGATGSAAPPTAHRDVFSGSEVDVELDQLLRTSGMRTVYQPIVELDSGATVAFEALTRGPQGSVLERPDLLFAAARIAGRLAELDRVCQESALSVARQAGLTHPWTLFVNIEPETAYSAFPDPDGSGFERASKAGTAVLPRSGPVPRTAAESGRPRGDAGVAEPFRVLVELTERSLVEDPTELLLLVARIRARGWGVALDDLGANRESLALLPLLRPDVIKLDLRMIQSRANLEVAEIVSAVNAEAERSGTTVLAEGIETREHLNIALSMGATLGQGWMLGRPERLPARLPDFTGTMIPIVARRHPAFEDSPFVQSALLRPVRRSRKHLLIEISKHLERQSINVGDAAVVVSTFQDVSFFTPATKLRYAELVEHTAFVGAIGEGMPPEPLPGVRSCLLEADDPLIAEWVIVVLGPHFSGLLAARDLGDSGPDAARRFDFVLSHDRELSINVALNLMSRVWARPATPVAGRPSETPMPNPGGLAA